MYYQRYLQAGRGPDFVAAGVTGRGVVHGFYWKEQFGSAGTVIVLTAIGGLGGAGLYGLFRPKPVAEGRAGGVEPWAGGLSEPDAAGALPGATSRTFAHGGT